MKKKYIIPTAGTVNISRMLMQTGSRVTSASTNLTGNDEIVIGGTSTSGARSNFFGGSIWDDTDYEE